MGRLLKPRSMNWLSGRLSTDCVGSPWPMNRFAVELEAEMVAADGDRMADVDCTAVDTVVLPDEGNGGVVRTEEPVDVVICVEDKVMGSVAIHNTVVDEVIVVVIAEATTTANGALDIVNWFPSLNGSITVL